MTTDKLTCGSCEAKLLAMLEAMETGGDDCVCDDFGLWETLCADMLSEEETRRLAEHLDVCEACRQECADAHKLGVYKGTPFYARMAAYGEESDENWKKIARTFDKSLGENADVPKTKDFADIIIDKIAAVKPSVKKDVDNRKTSSRWRVAGYSAAAAAFFAATLTAGPEVGEMARNIFKPNPPTPRIVDVSDVPNPLPSDEGGARSLGNASSNGEIPSDLGGARSLGNALSNGNGAGRAAISFGARPLGNAYHEATETEAASSDLSASSTVREPELNEGAKMGTEEKFALLSLDGLSSNVLQDYQNAVDSFDDGDFKTAAKDLGALIETLKASEEVDDEMLNRAYWNWGVATMLSGDKAGAKDIFEALKAREPGDKMRATADAALEECQN